MSANELLAAARRAAAGAAAVHREHLGRVAVQDWTEKGSADFVTHVDRAAEAAILAVIRQRFPDHDVMAEEEASERERASGVTMKAGRGWTWIIDPLDGTTNFLHGYPAYAVSIAAVRAGVLEAAVVLDSAAGREWLAVRDGGAWLDGARIGVSQIADPRRALIGTGFPFKSLHLLPTYTTQLQRVLRSTSGVRRAGSAALDLCHLATGWFDGFWELSLAPWDVAAGTLIVREAGGIVTRMDGSADVLGHGSILAGNPSIHATLGALLNEAGNVVPTADPQRN